MATTLPQSFRDDLPEGEWDFFVRSPGRINLIGEHLDYNGGSVLPAAIDLAIYFAVRKREVPNIQLHALDLGQSVMIVPTQDQPSGIQWADYLLGICREFRLLGHTIPPLEIALGGDLPSGAGVSSSAALEGGMAFLLNEVLQAELDRMQLARLCQRSSNHFLGIPTGIMDQFASLHGQAGKALLLDTATMKYEEIPANLPGYSWVLINSMIKHDISAGEYKERVDECQMALQMIQQKFPDCKYLAQASPGKIKSVDKLAPNCRDRAMYVAHEQYRVADAAKILQEDHPVRIGQLLNSTHKGLRDQYEVSCEEVDFLQSFAEAHEGVKGSRIMGGGFGGCTLNLVSDEQVNFFVEDVKRAYLWKYKIEAQAIPVRIANGTELIEA
ncbi:MAG: galactokinase [Bacteroidota bacterium]